MIISYLNKDLKMSTYTTSAITFYMVLSSTGCSCCSSENYADGPYLDLELAKRSRDSCNNPSQYSKKGNNRVKEFEGTLFTPMDENENAFIKYENSCLELDNQNFMDEAGYDLFSWGGTLIKD